MNLFGTTPEEQRRMERIQMLTDSLINAQERLGKLEHLKDNGIVSGELSIKYKLHGKHRSTVLPFKRQYMNTFFTAEIARLTERVSTLKTTLKQVVNQLNGV